MSSINVTKGMNSMNSMKTSPAVARVLGSVLLLAACCPARLGAVETLPPGGLLRNGTFHDDWLTILPELKNHHWNYTTEVYNRRDFNPDGWTLAGNWQWLDADDPRGRRLVLAGPGTTVSQSVNWGAFNNPAALAGWPDAGGYPAEQAARTANPAALVRDLAVRVKLSGQGVPEKAGEVVLTLGEDANAVSGTVPLAAGTYRQTVVEVKLPAAQWVEKAKSAPDFAAKGAALPKAVSCAIRYGAAAGSVELHEATLEAAPSAAPAVWGSGFEQADADGYPTGWSRPQKYFYFPPGIYYIFNTWHNSTSDNRGPVTGDPLVPFRGQRSLKMVLPTGDEKCVVSDPILLKQAKPQLIEATVWVKTDRAGMLQIDAEDESGRRIDGYNFIHKYPISIGTNDWRQLRQVFVPTKPLESIRIKLAGRGLNGYTLDDTSEQPQNNVCGTIWWDDLVVSEPETTAAELAARGIKPAAPAAVAAARPHLADLRLGEQLFGDNELTATIVNPATAGSWKLVWDLVTPTGATLSFTSPAIAVPQGGRAAVRLPYRIDEPCPAYAECRGVLKLVDGGGKVVAESPQWLSTWTVPIDVEMGALYLQPDATRQFVKLNLGVSAAAITKAKAVRLEVVRRGTGQPISAIDVPVSRAAFEEQRRKIPADMRDDFANLLLVDVDVSKLPIQPFNDPQRNWFLRATVLDQAGGSLAAAESQPFCRLARDPQQPPIGSVRIDTDNLLYVNDKPWMPWGVTYGHTPAYAGPADPGPGKYRDLRNLKPWVIYDRHGGDLVSRPKWDGNAVRFVAGAKAGFPTAKMDELWTKENIYTSSAFVVPDPAWSLEEAARMVVTKDKPDGKANLAANLAFCKSAPMVVSTAVGIEEAFGNISNATDAQIAGMKEVAAHFRTATGKPVMVGHGGYWNRIEFERVPYFDIYDPETEPFYPANLHTDMLPLIRGQAKVAWLRPQMYEDVPYERWRYHVWVEMMRGARGWQLAHGPGDASTYRGLHAEMEQFKPVLYSKAPAPAVTTAPLMEHMTRTLEGKTYVVVATTHGLPFGTWAWSGEPAGPGGRARETGKEHAWRDEVTGYSTFNPPPTGPSLHGIQYLPHARSWPKGSRLVQWLKVAAGTAPANVVALVKADGRWVPAATWGTFDLAKLRGDKVRAHWLIRALYRHSSGFLGWGSDVPPFALKLIPETAKAMGGIPAAGEWVKVELPLEAIGAADKLVDGVGFLHEGGRVSWGRTSLVAPDGFEQIVFGDHIDRPPPDELRAAKISVAGLKKGTKVRVLYEDRALEAGDGFFTDDCTGTDLYQRFGGHETGYGDAPVALHVYEVKVE